MTASRRTYALTLVACLAGAGLALYAATRTWSLQITPRTGVSPLRTARTGADVEPWVVGLAVVALAGAGALLATRGVVRRALGVLLTLAGVVVLAGAIAGRVGLEVGSAGAGGTFWPIVCAAGGAIIGVGGVLAARDGHRWPVMSARYERPAPRTASRNASQAEGASRVEGASLADVPARRAAAENDNRVAWEALDRGDDPTA